jgi:hypothetical protein
MKNFFLSIVLLFICISLSAQFQESIDEILASETLTAAQALFLVDQASNQESSDIPISELWLMKRSNYAALNEKEADSPFLQGDLSYLIMEGFNISGGLMYSIAPGTRYAVRELAFLGIIKGNDHPDKVLSGEEALLLITRTLSHLEDV